MSEIEQAKIEAFGKIFLEIRIFNSAIRFLKKIRSRILILMGLLVGFGGNLAWAGNWNGVSKSSEAKPRELRIYQNNFQTDEIGPEWSSRSPAPWGVRHAPVPSGFHRKFLGFFGGNEELTLRLRGLPSGTFALVLEFDVYLIGSWDGDDPSQVDSVVLGGPDVFGFRYSDGSQPAWQVRRQASHFSVVAFRYDRAQSPIISMNPGESTM